MKRQDKPTQKSHFNPVNINEIYPIKNLNKIGSTPLIINKQYLNQTYFDLTYSRRYEAMKKNQINKDTNSNLYINKLNKNINHNKIEKDKKGILAKPKKQSQILKNRDYASQKQYAFKSLNFFSQLMKKSSIKSSEKQKKHFPSTTNPQSYKLFNDGKEQKKTKYFVSSSRHKKLLYDFQDKIQFNNISDSRRHSVSQSDVKLTGKRKSYVLNMFRQSYELGIDEKHTMRKPNKSRTRSTLKLG